MGYENLKQGALPQSTEIVLERPRSDSSMVLPAIIEQAGRNASKRFLEFFTANIRNRNTRAAYARAVARFLRWCEERHLSLDDIEPVTVATYIETHPGSDPTKKQHLAAIRMLFDWLVIGQVLPANPAASVRGPKYVVKRGNTERKRDLRSLPSGASY